MSVKILLGKSKKIRREEDTAKNYASLYLILKSLQFF